MKIGMNSQCLRVKRDGKTIIDYHINDGTIGKKFMNFVGGVAVPDHFDGYESKSVDGIDSVMSWGGPNDKMTDINMIDLENKGEFGDMDTRTPDSYANRSYMGGSVAPSNVYSYKTTYGIPKHKPVVMTPPKPRYDFSKTSENDKNFKKLFGK